MKADFKFISRLQPFEIAALIRSGLVAPKAADILRVLLGYTVWLLIVTFFVTFSLQTQAQVRLEQWTSGYMDVDQIPGGSEDEIRTQADHLASLWRDGIRPQVPADILKAFEKFQLHVSISAQCPLDGEFLDPGTDAKVLTICMRPGVLERDDVDQFFTHEMFHAIHYAIHPNEEAWMREGMAQFFEFLILNKYNVNHVRAAYDNPFTPLIPAEDFYSVELNPAELQNTVRTRDAEYGHDFLFIYYLETHCGGPDLFWNITRGVPGLYGKAGIDSLLKNAAQPAEKNACADFESTALDFEVAKIHNRVAYDFKGQEDRRYFLAQIPFRWEGRPAETLSTADFAKRESLNPLILDARVDTGSLNGLNNVIYWVRQDFPYTVQKIAPSPSSSPWLQIVIKK